MPVPTSNISIANINSEVSSVNSESLTTLAGNSIAYTGGASTAVTNNVQSAPHAIKEWSGYVHTQNNSGDVNNANGTWLLEQYRLGASSNTDTGNRSYYSNTSEVGYGFEANDMRAVARIRPLSSSYAGYSFTYVYCEICVTASSGSGGQTVSYSPAGATTNRNKGVFVLAALMTPSSFFGSGTPDSYGLSYSRNETYSATQYGTSGRNWQSTYDSTNSSNFATSTRTTYNAHSNNFSALTSNQSTGLGFYQSISASNNPGSNASSYVKNDINIEFKARKAGYHDFTFATCLLTMRTDVTSIWGGGYIP